MTLRQHVARSTAGATALVVGAGLMGAVATPAAGAEGDVLRGVASDLCITVPDGGAGEILTLQSCDGGPTQQWVETADGELAAPGDLCMDLAAAPDAGTRVVAADCDGSDTQQWDVLEDLTIQSGADGRLCVDAWQAATTPGTEIATWWCSGAPNQLWERTVEPATPSVVVDLADSTGPIHGGATGVLYGMSDDGVPSDDLVAGQRPRTLAQKPPNGDQHPNGDVLDISDAFFDNGGEQMVVYMQDVYSRWPYQEPDDIQADYLPKIRQQMQAVIDSGLPMEKFAWVPFNEPDGIWYQNWGGGERENFLRDWDAAYEVIREMDPDAVIVGPNEAVWHADRVRDLMTHAQEAGTLPDVMAWHELGTGSLGSRGYRAHFEEYRQLERDLGIDPLPINIDEYGNRHDMGNPGRLIQWLSMFEDTKVDGDMAFWTYAGNLSDHAVQTAMANGGWWLNKWYSDLSGHTVALTPEAVRPDTLQGIAALDESKRLATVLVGGNDDGGVLRVQNMPADVLGDTVDVFVESTDVTGQEGEASSPMVDSVTRMTVTDGGIEVPVPADAQSAYRVSIVPAAGDAPAEPDAVWSASYEAEDATLVDAQAYSQTGDWSYAASGLADVGSFNRPSSRVTFDVEVPADGTYELGVIAGNDKTWSQHALYVDDAYVGRVTYSATLGWTYRARAEVQVDLSAGAHEVSLRATGPDGPLDVNYDVTLDRLDVSVPEPEELTFPLWQARLSGDVSVDHSSTDRPVTLEADAAAQLFVGAPADGYYDLVRSGSAENDGTLEVLVSGRDLGGEAGAVPAGEGTVSTTVFLHRGVNEVRLTNTGGTPVTVSSLSTVRNTDADDATVAVEAEDLQVQGEAATASSRWASGGTYVGDVGQDGSLVWERPDGVDAGEYVLTVGYANAEVNLGHPYNTDVVTRFVDTTEAGGDTTRSPYRHNYTWDGFWDVSSDLDLTTDDGALTFARSDGSAPNIDRLSLSPFTLGTTVDVEGPEPTDSVGPVVTVKDGERFTVGRDGTYSKVSFTLHDVDGLVDRLTLNGVEKDLTDDAWSDLNFVTPGMFGAVEGANTLVVYDVAGNATTVEFTLDVTAPTVTVKDGERFTDVVNAKKNRYRMVSFKLHDAGKVDTVVLNGVEKGLSDNAWSDLNFVKVGAFGAVKGENTLVVHDVAGNTTTVEFELRKPKE
ncbi:ricin-type beta-trefoil lectin domain protein [Phycicoccus sp. BSK3Z-2]|uniref:Ricin-type beta-trefoil lectin domain protein n=1 Tax=Phycicoccus avicenniae TaxID=2828860 RepID=A0A941D7Q8_9MICO|nr:ricin-type beta-trefoil lectin domain protein [Phycicoccus avicenniae]MBR7742052.1 ricin-type beta-trefoil lectin domain protein [Phycicoccus avicenniae]